MPTLQLELSNEELHQILVKRSKDRQREEYPHQNTGGENSGNNANHANAHGDRVLAHANLALFIG